MQISDLPFISNTFSNSELVKQVELFLFYRWGNQNSSDTQVRLTSGRTHEYGRPSVSADTEADYTWPFYIRNSSIRGFWYL